MSDEEQLQGPERLPREASRILVTDCHYLKDFLETEWMDFVFLPS
jgi:hypothetical protein